jgi:hypothetical protein
LDEAKRSYMSFEVILPEGLHKETPTVTVLDRRYNDDLRNTHFFVSDHVHLARSA